MYKYEYGLRKANAIGHKRRYYWYIQVYVRTGTIKPVVRHNFVRLLVLLAIYCNGTHTATIDLL
jgi:hypothetical protein